MVSANGHTKMDVDEYIDILDIHVKKLAETIKEDNKQHIRSEIRLMWIVFGCIFALFGTIISINFNQIFTLSREVTAVKYNQQTIDTNIPRKLQFIDLRINLILATISNDKIELNNINKEISKLESQSSILPK